MSSVEYEANLRYKKFHRSKRGILYNLVLAHPEFPFRETSENSELGLWFEVSTGDYKSPISKQSLTEVVTILSKIHRYNQAQKYKIYSIYISAMKNIDNN